MSNPPNQADAINPNPEEPSAKATPPEPVLTETDEEVIRKRLQELGYIE